MKQAPTLESMMSDEAFLALIEKITTQNIDPMDLIGKADALKAAGKRDQVVQLYKAWIEHNKDARLLYAIYFNLSVSLSDVGSLAEAKECLEKAIEINPDFYPAYINLGTVLERLGTAGMGVAKWIELSNRLGAVSGSSVDYRTMSLKQIGRVLELHRRPWDAENALRENLEILPNQGDVIQHYIALRLVQCKWPVLVPPGKMSRKDLINGMGPLSMSIYTDDPMLQLACAWNYSRNFMGYPMYDLRDKHRNLKSEHQGRRRIGYVSSDLRNHAVGYQMAEMFGVHDRSKYEIFIYYCGVMEKDDLRERIKASVEHWIDINGMKEEAIAQRMVDDGIDILVDVNGYTKDARAKVFPLRPAPIIANWFGYPGSAGSPCHHYIIADDWIIPKDHELYYSEKVMRLPCYQPNDSKRVVADKQYSRAELGLPENAFIFCCFNGLQKISRFTFERWMAILKGVPNSVLWLLEGSEDVHQRLRESAEKYGISPDRLVFATKMANPFHLARYRLADLFLDTSPYGAHVTAADSLWMGVPILTFSGRGFASRVCSSLTRAAGLPEMVCTTPQEYVERAIALGNNVAEVKRLKAKLSANRDTCVLFNTELLVRSLEGLYDQMWQEYCSGKLPRPDLTNMDMYMDIGTEFDHDAIEMLAVDDYSERYKSIISQRHKYYPIASDNRLWTLEAISEAEHGHLSVANENITIDEGAQSDNSFMSKLRRLAGKP